MDVVVNTTELASVAKNRLGGAGEGGVIGHLHERAAPLTEIAGAAETRLFGGYGATGGYQTGLRAFSVEFTKLLEKFNVEHSVFVSFLEGLRDRMNTAAGVYHEVEQQNVGRFQAIASQLDAEQGDR